MRTTTRRLNKLEHITFGSKQSRNEPSPAEVIRERRRLRFLADGGEPEKTTPPISRFDEHGRPQTIADILRKGRYQHRERNLSTERHK